MNDTPTALQRMAASMSAGMQAMSLALTRHAISVGGAEQQRRVREQAAALDGVVLGTDLCGQDPAWHRLNLCRFRTRPIDLTVWPTTVDRCDFRVRRATQQRLMGASGREVEPRG